MIDGRMFFNDSRYRVFARPNIFPFPCERADMPPTKDIPPLFRRMIRRTPDDVHKILRKEWASIQSPAVARFRDALLETFPPFALARTWKPIFKRRIWYLMLASQEFPGRTVYVESPNVTLLDTYLQDFASEARDEIREFFQNFAGLTELSWQFGGFLRLEDWGRCEDCFAESLNDSASEWKDSWVFYCAPNGDYLLLKNDGRVAWLLHETGQTKIVAECFREFVEFCAVWFRINSSHTGISLDHDIWMRWRDKHS